MSKTTDWEAIEREYRAGSISVRAIADKHGITEGAIRKKAKAESWKRALAEKVRTLVREKLVRSDGTQKQRATDDEVAETAALVGVEVQLSHRRDLQQLHGLKRIIAGRLATYLQGGQPDGPFIGDKESPGDLLEKLSRVTSRLIPLERQAHNLDAGNDDPLSVKIEGDAAFSELVGALEIAAAARARGAGGKSGMDIESEA